MSTRHHNRYELRRRKAEAASLDIRVKTLEDNPGGGGATNTVTDYRSSYDEPYVYSGYVLNGSPVITRCLDGVKETAQGVTNLNTDWPNRTSLTYV